MFKAISIVELLFSGAILAAGQSTYPNVTLRYNGLFDMACAEATRQPIEPEAIKELRSRMESIRALWRKEGAQLLGAVPEVTEVPFRFHEASTTLILCPGFPNGLSTPLLINMRMYLTATSKESAVPIIDFTNALFHELLHLYVTDCLGLPPRNTPIMEKYSVEPQPVRSHLHLYAIEGLVYKKLGREKDFAISIAAEQTLKEGGTLKRAREIVAKEGAENIVRELKGGSQ